MPNTHAVGWHNAAMSKQETSILDRVIEAAKDKGLPTTQKAIGAVAGVGQSSVSRWSDENPPTLENALALAEGYGVCVEWLYTGRGPKTPAGVDPKLQELTDIFLKLPIDVQEEVLGYLRYKHSTTFTGDPARRKAFESTLPRYKTVPRKPR